MINNTTSNSLTTTAQICCDNCSRPDLKKGDALKEGVFLKNFNEGLEVGKRYPDDTDYKFGRIIKTAFLKEKNPKQMSVNGLTCVGDICCSPLLQAGHPQKIQNSVAMLDLKRIRGILEEDGESLVHAVYKPIEKNDKNGHPGNPCHFDIEFEEEIGLQIRATLRNCLRADWLPNKKPSNDEDKQNLLEELKAHREVIDFHFDVIPETQIRQDS